MGKQPKFTLGKTYTEIVSFLFFISLICLVSAIILSIYVDHFEKHNGMVEILIERLWDAFILVLGGLLGVVTGPRFAKPH